MCRAATSRPSPLLQFEVPAQLGSFYVQLAGCGTGADGQPAPRPEPGKEAADVKAFVSFATPKPSLWDVLQQLSWCSDAPTLLVSPNQTASPTILHLSVFATAPSRFTLLVTRSTVELVFGELSTHVVNCPSELRDEQFGTHVLRASARCDMHRQVERGAWSNAGGYTGWECTKCH